MGWENRDMRTAEAEKKAAAPAAQTHRADDRVLSTRALRRQLGAGHHLGVQIQLDFKQIEVRRRNAPPLGR
jgi:hypothetical protein